jgi:Cu(I)/Ag(I) efflux system membrane fusion protein
METMKFVDFKKRIVLLLVIAVAMFLGFWLRGLFTPAQQEPPLSMETQAAVPEVWTCAMHPQIRLPKAGLCPICHMDLIQVETQEVGERQLSVSDTARKLMEIETVPVERRFVTATIRMSGKVDFDETRLVSVTSRIAGRLDRLFVDYTGVTVQKGDHLVSLYSPDLLTAQEELLQALESAKNIQNSNLAIMRDSAEATVTAVREKLRLWGLTPEQIGEIERSGQVSDHVTIYAPSGGIVVHKEAVEGMYVQEGTHIYTIADLSQVWVKLDAYESDLEWIRYGQRVELSTVSYPGEIFRGTIAFIDPILDARTRTVKVRVNVDNTKGKLKPNMFVKAIVSSKVAGGGKIMDAELAGQWICPMHPDVIKPVSGICDICEMDLVTSESLGYVSDDVGLAEMPLVIPVSAALITGTRAVVYVRLPDMEKPTYEGREIVLGPRAGNSYLVRSGHLREGELVVVKGNFKIDSALQIQAKASMMNPKQTRGANTHPTFKHYFAIQEALVNDQFDEANEAAKEMANTETTSKELKEILETFALATDLKSQRKTFDLIAQQIILTAKETAPEDFYVMRCPMAVDNQPADWLQRDKKIRNPYMGQAMLSCGRISETIPARATAHD